MITITMPKNKEIVRVYDLEIGDTGIILEPESGDYAGNLVLRTYDGLVSLSNPTQTWEIDPDRRPPFIMIKKVDIEINVKERS